MKKRVLRLGIVVLFGMIGVAFFKTGSTTTTGLKLKNDFITIGKVDFSDNDTKDDTINDSDLETQFESFIKTYQTPFSKTIKK
ncbi:MAG: hypothetical protein SOV02_01945 [Streptococcus infantarius]|nr:hypothetical protein [Streptococcus infantarius]